MRFVDDDGATPRRKRSGPGFTSIRGHFEQLAGDERELLKSRDDDWNALLQSFCQLPRAFVDLLHDTAFMLELVDRVLKLVVARENHCLRLDLASLVVALLVGL